MQNIKNMIALLDFTNLKSNDEEQLIRFCKTAITPFGRVASICLLPDYLTAARKFLDENHGEQIKISTVINYQREALQYEEIIDLSAQYLQNAQELELIFPHQLLIDKNIREIERLFSGVKALCLAHKATLKILLEREDFPNSELVSQALEISCANGADFIKSASIYHKHGDNLDEVAQILKFNCGVKFSPSPNGLESASLHLKQIAESKGSAWLTAQNVRISCAMLINEILDKLGVKTSY